MDLERAQGIVHQIETMEPINPVEGLSPLQRFQAIGKRIENLPTVQNYGFDKEMRVILGSGRKNVKLQLRNSYNTFADGRSDHSPILIGVEASWHRGRDVFAREVIRLDEVNRKYSDRILGLIEESVAEAEKVLKPKRVTKSTKV